MDSRNNAITGPQKINSCVPDSLGCHDRVVSGCRKRPLYSKKTVLPRWNSKMIAGRLEEAARVLKRLPAVRPKQVQSSWPPIIQEFWEAYGWNDVKTRLGPPSPDAISRMDECMEWLLWLEQDQIQIVWAKAEMFPWKMIIKRFGVSRATAWRKWSSSLSELAVRLNSQ